jgi:hypothetical protein
VPRSLTVLTQGLGGYWHVTCYCMCTIASMIIGKFISDSMSLTLSSQVSDMNPISIELKSWALTR